MIFFLPFIFISSLAARELVMRHDTVHLHEGNLALRTAQQPAPLFSFGQFLVDKGNIQGFLTPAWVTGDHRYFSSFTPSFVYGIENLVAVLGGITTYPKQKQKSARSAGVGDIFMQIEGAFYYHDTLTHVDKATLVTGLTFPSGSATKNPPTGLGTPSIFLGVTTHRRGSHGIIGFHRG